MTTYIVPSTERQLIRAYELGEERGFAGGYLSDNPYRYETERWHVWREGYMYGKSDRSVHVRNRSA